MILIDAATGSNEFEEPLRKKGLPVDVTHLDYGDFVFNGRGEGGEPLYIGIEFKKLTELVESLRSKRFQGHQLLGLCKDFDRRYLVVEGDFHHDKQGRATVFRGKGQPRPIPGVVNAVALEQEIINLGTRGGCWVKTTTTRAQTLRFIEAVYRYWTDKDLDQHKSHLAVYAPDFDRALLTPTSDFRKIVTLVLPGCGLAVSKAVEDACLIQTPEGKRPSMARLFGLSEQQLAELSTKAANGKERRLGESKAKQIKSTLEALR